MFSSYGILLKLSGKLKLHFEINNTFPWENKVKSSLLCQTVCYQYLFLAVDEETLPVSLPCMQNNLVSRITAKKGKTYKPTEL